MEKIVNLQAPGSMPAAVGASRQAQANVQETKDDFIKLLQQQKETAKQPEDTKDTKKNNSTKDVKPEEAQPGEPKEEPVEEAEDPKEDLLELTQLELNIQQSLLQQNIVQSVEPEPVDLTAVSGVLAAEEVVPEAALEPVVQEQTAEASALTEAVKPEPVKSEEKPEPVKTEAPLQAEQQAEKPVEAPGETHPESGLQTSEQPKDTKAPAAERQGSLQSEEEPVKASEQNPEGQTGVQAAETPVQKEESFGTRFQAEETTVKATMEELPQELGKAVTVGRPGESHTLTVELEPASLGKMTIRLQYEAGRTLVSVMASNPKTLELLQEKATEIAAILKERTGEETVIYTEEPKREPGEEAQQQGNRGGQPQERRQHKEEDRSETESFMLKLRLGLV